MNRDALEERARQSAEQAGWVAYKSGWRAGTADNRGGFRIFDPEANATIHGARFDLTAERVIELCAEQPAEPTRVVEAVLQLA